ncbi:MAG: pirin family protein [Chitinophagaceae bacterium]|nr:MAG: pirin family protein [Chitinophagaceae bacterium]
MFKIIRANERHLADHGWLKSYFLFSFADYYDPANTNFGPLRVFNDDTIAGNSGFPQHPHHNMEIVTVMLKGEITHQDSTGTKSTIKAGEVQRMTAGTGLTHSEANEGEEEVHMYQIWFIPGTQGLSPSYEQKELNFLDTDNELIPLVSGQKVLEDVVYMNSNSTIYWCNLETDKTVGMDTFEVREIFVYVKEGSLTVNGHSLGTNDQLRLSRTEKLDFKATTDCQFILIDLPSEFNF